MNTNLIFFKLFTLIYIFANASSSINATENLLPSKDPHEQDDRQHHHHLCHVLTTLKFDEHHFKTPTTLESAIQNGAKIVHDTTVATVRSSLEGDKTAVSTPPRTSSLSSLASVPGKVVAYFINSLPYGQTTPPRSQSTPILSSDLSSDFVMIPQATSFYSPTLDENYENLSSRSRRSKPPSRIVISYDGGGVRGAIGANLTQRLEKLTNRYISEIGDSAVGTSIGGMMVLGYTTSADGKKPILDGNSTQAMFEAEFEELLNPRWQYNYLGKFYDAASGLLYSKYPSAPIENLCRKNYGDYTLGDCLIPTSTTAFDPNNDTPFIFSSDKTPFYKTWQVARTTSAAPTYWNLFRPDINGNVDGQPYLGDGGLVYNNPAMLGILEEKRRNPNGFNLDNVVLWSVGTGWADVENKLATNAGLLRAAQPVLNAAINSQVKGTEQAMVTLLKPENNFRLNPKLKRTIPLDEANSEIFQELKEAAETQYEIIDKFIEHEAVRQKLEEPRRSDLF
ncbi:MAG: hypothetical protein FJX03_01775 [Alphaproteobacteria bacterium]|nr:hypothetical protein [Alphaproteobacteria bacterium]